MLPVPSRLVRTVVYLTLTGIAPLRGVAQATSGGGFAPGARTILDLEFSTTAIGDFPKGLRLLQGNLEVVNRDGVHMLRASSPSEFAIQLPEALPPKFTVEFELIPKTCCNPVDLMLEGVISGSRSSVSAQLEWHPGHFAVVGGNPDMFQMDMPAAIAATLPATLTHVAVSFDDETVRMYTNGQRLYSLNNRKFVRGRVLRISLGGHDDDKYAVYLSRLLIADAATTLAPNAATGTTASYCPKASPGICRPSATTQLTALSSPTNPLSTIIGGAVAQQQNAVTSPGTTAVAPVAASTGPLSSVTGPAALSPNLAGPTQLQTWSVAQNTPPGWGIVLNWETVAAATSYRVSRARLGSGRPGAAVPVVDLTTAASALPGIVAIDSDVEPYVDYTYWVEGVLVSGALTNPSPVSTVSSGRPPSITGLAATVSGTTQVVVPHSPGVTTAGSNVTWSWAPLALVFAYEISYEIVGTGIAIRKTISASPTVPATVAPVRYGVPQGGSVKFCVSTWAPADKTQPLPPTATCLTTQVP